MLIHPPTTADVLVIGAGAVGASIAYELARRGASVHVVDAGGTAGAGCSHANAGLIAPSHVEPLATPANIVLGLRSLLRPDSPFSVRPTPRLAPFLAELALSARPGRVRLLTERLHELAGRSLQLHEEYAKSGLTTSFQRNGLMDVFLTENRFLTAVDTLQRHPDGLAYAALDATEARRLEPALGAIAGGIFRPDEAQCDSREFVESMLAAAQAAGAHVTWNTTVRQLVRRHGRIVAARTGQDSITAGSFVVTAGLGSQDLCRSAGIRLPMQGATGYVVDTVTEGAHPRIPLSIREPRVVATPYPRWLRMCGTLELSGRPNRLSSRRMRAVPRGIARALPGITISRTVQEWAGQRPCTADGVPVIGRSSSARNLVVATGHAMWGLTLGPVTGELIARGLVEGASTLHEASFSPDRFSSPRGLTPLPTSFLARPRAREA